MTRFALVAYVRTPAGQFVEQLQREFLPQAPDFAAHVTLLPPRCLQDTETVALEELKEGCSEIEPFEVTLGEVETFIPVTPTLFIRIGSSAQRMIDIHNLMNRGALRAEEQWPYMPHMTIAKMNTEYEAHEASVVARKRWEEFSGSRKILLSECTFVREDEPGHWRDIAGIPLGHSVVKG